MKPQQVLQRKCDRYVKDQLRPPPPRLIARWGKKLGMTPKECRDVSDNLLLRGQLGN